jgi:hypothetical protein
MSKKFCLIFYNCMGNSIKKQLIQSKQFINIYNIIYISLYDYLEGYKYGNKNQLINEHIDLLSKADLLIVQSLRKNRNHLNFDNIIKFIKKKCISIKIPQYTFSGYHYPYNILKDENININYSFESLNEYLKNLFINQKKEILKNLDNELLHIKELDTISDIKCYEFIKNNYKNKLLFNNRQYPTYFLFHFIAQAILNYLNIDDKISPLYDRIGQDSLEPIFNNVYKYLELEFKLLKFCIDCTIEEYIVCCKKLNVERLYLKYRSYGKKHCDTLNNIIKSKKFKKID